jgi:hypothetical protein
MMTEPTILTVEEVAMIIAGLDRLVSDEPTGSTMVNQYRARMVPYAALRNRLKASLGVGFYESGISWVDELLRNEREATLGKLGSVLRAAIKDPATNRRTLQETLARMSQDLIHGGRQWHEPSGIDQVVADTTRRNQT